tara:strand:- start:767 stop:1720 length:954 start_codon:yes stop_codon:yes gene_type:complete
MKNSVAIFGGSGFIGHHLIEKIGSKYYNFDINESQNNFVYCDVREPVKNKIKYKIDTVFNLAALCTIPKYDEQDYYNTNVLGAENVCNFARDNNIKTIVFTSSISPYGMRENKMTEDSLTMPTNEYGISKLIAEYIHIKWQAEKKDERCLVILRPGIVFGKNENGNFSRLYMAMKKGVFFYPGRKDSKKACIYVKDLANILVDSSNIEKIGVNIYNCCYPKPFSIEEICNAISKVTAVKKPNLIIPGWLLKITSSFIYLFARILRKNFLGIHPDRIDKLLISTNISGAKLSKNYLLKFSFIDAINDWYKDCDNNGLF